MRPRSIQAEKILTNQDVIEAISGSLRLAVSDSQAGCLSCLGVSNNGDTSRAKIIRDALHIKGFGAVQQSSSSPAMSGVEGKAAASFARGSVHQVREHGKLSTCLCEAASAGMEPLTCQP